jgi:hypothetical protein
VKSGTAAACEVMAAYDELVARALAVVDEAPYWTYVSNECHAKLAVSDGLAVLTWPEEETCWDNTTIETRSVSFPLEFLTMPEGELRAWKKEQLRQYNLEKRRREAQRKAEVELKERAALAALQAKYGQG